MSSQRPELGPVKVGDELIRKGRGQAETYRVVKVGRVYATMVRWNQADDYPWPERMNLKTGHEKGRGNFSSNYSYYTQEQLAWHERKDAAEAYLKSVGVEVSWKAAGVRWRDDLVTLANLLRRHDGLEEL